MKKSICTKCFFCCFKQKQSLGSPDFGTPVIWLLTSPVYCTTPALAGYSSYSVRIPRILMKASFHICGTTLHARQHDPSHLLPSISFASIQTELSRTICGSLIGSFPDRHLSAT